MDKIKCKECGKVFILDELSIEEIAALNGCCLDAIDQVRIDAKFKPVYPNWFIEDKEGE